MHMYARQGETEICLFAHGHEVSMCREGQSGLRSFVISMPIMEAEIQGAS